LNASLINTADAALDAPSRASVDRAWDTFGARAH